MIAYQASTCAWVFQASVATRSRARTPKLASTSDALRRAPVELRVSHALDAAALAGGHHLGTRMPLRGVFQELVEGQRERLHRAVDHRHVAPRRRQRRRCKPDVPVPRNAARGAAPAHDLFVELVHAGEQMRLRPRRVLERHVRARAAVRRPLRLSRGAGHARARERRPVVDHRIGETASRPAFAAPWASSAAPCPRCRRRRESRWHGRRAGLSHRPPDSRDRIDRGRTAGRPRSAWSPAVPRSSRTAHRAWSPACSPACRSTDRARGRRRRGRHTCSRICLFVGRRIRWHRRHQDAQRTDLTAVESREHRHLRLLAAIEDFHELARQDAAVDDEERKESIGGRDIGDLLRRPWSAARPDRRRPTSPPARLPPLRRRSRRRSWRAAPASRSCRRSASRLGEQPARAGRRHQVHHAEAARGFPGDRDVGRIAAERLDVALHPAQAPRSDPADRSCPRSSAAIPRSAPDARGNPARPGGS